jgi:hypothetical protein
LPPTSFGELGPLDLTTRRQVSPGDGARGLANVRELDGMRAEADRSLEQQVSGFRTRLALGLMPHTAINHGSPLAAEPMGPAQIDPFAVAEVELAIATATLYAQRLGADHLKEGALDRLLTGYPSHDFVIDREEASDLLHTVRAPTPEEGLFLTYLEPVVTARRLQGRMLWLEDALTLMDADEQPDRARLDRASG